MSGVTDFIVAGPAGHFQAGEAGSFKAGEPGHVQIGPPAFVPVSPAGHVPIDTSMARIPYAAPGGGMMTQDNVGGANYTIEQGTGSIVNGSGGYVGGGAGMSSGGGSISSGSGIGLGGSGGGISNVSSGAPVSMPGQGRVDNAAGNVTPSQQGAESHFLPGGQVPIGATEGGVFTPGGQVPIETGGGGKVSGGPGTLTHATGSVPVSPGYSHFTPGGMVPMGMGGSHYVPGGMVPISPKLGIAPNIPPARVNPPRAGYVQPPRATNWHGPQQVHEQSMPRNQFHHHTQNRAWEPHKAISAWEPPKGFEPFLTTDQIDLGALTQSSKGVSMQDSSQPQVKNTNFDMSHNYTVDQSIHPEQNFTLDLAYQSSSEFNYQAASEGDMNMDLRDQRPVTNDFSETTQLETDVDLSMDVNVGNEFKEDHSTIVNYTETRNLAVDDSRSVHNDFSQFMDMESHFDTTVVNNTEITYQGGSMDFGFQSVRTSSSGASAERGAGSILTTKS